jgi:uncharacterized protein YeaO (DUF488 family)
MIRLKRVYDPPGDEDGTRFLVERLWPRGIKKSALPLDGWLKEAAPSTELRQWFQHDPARWEKFCQRYFEELKARPDAWKPILQAGRRGAVSLLYSSHDQEHNNAVALKMFLEVHRKAKNSR